MTDPRTDTPASHVKLFVLVILIMSAITVASFLLILRSRQSEAAPTFSSPVASLAAPLLPQVEV